MKKNRFYKMSSHGPCGSTSMFWAIGGNGYLSDIDKAHVYTLEEMKADVKSGDANYAKCPISSDHVDALSTWRVDSQYISQDDHYPKKKDPNDEYVSYRVQTWDGNDLYFCTGLGGSFDYSKSQVISSKMADFHIGDGVVDWVTIPKYISDEIARRTFQTININRRKMIQGAGIIGLRKPRKSRDSGKTRWNCPKCGKIHWQFNPYNFDGCDDWSCDSYNSNKWDGYDEC